jgi:hypothetical protein
MNCAQVKESLIDFLYDELPQDMRASFIEHLEGCPTCKAEVASFERTLGRARVALGGPLDEEPPARIHLAAIEAAKTAAKPAARTKSPAPREELGFFARLWRTPWFLPAFGAASIATAVFLVRVLKNPEVLPGQHPHAIEERSLALPQGPSPETVPADQPMTAPTAATERPSNLAETKAIGSRVGADKAAAKRSVARSHATASSSKGGGGPMLFAEPPPPRPTAAKASKDVDDLLGGFKETESLQRRAQPAVAPAASTPEWARGEEAHDEQPAKKLASPAKKMPRNEPTQDRARPSTLSPSAGTSAGALAPAPAPPRAPVGAPAPLPARTYPAESATSTPPPSGPPAVKRKAGRQSSEEAPGSAERPYDDLAKESKEVNGAKDKNVRSSNTPGPSLEESLRRAERLYANQDWSAAATAYRDLLNRFPNHKDVQRWRARMNESNIAYQRTLEAKRKKTTSDDPLSGSMK